MRQFIELIKKEVYRFMTVWMQTIIAPATTALLYQLIFGQQLASLATGVANVGYSAFLIPGLVMMQVIQNSFANGSSSLIQSKYNGNIVFVLMAPISPLAIYGAYLIASIIRGIIVGGVVLATICWFGMGFPKSIPTLLFFLFFGSAIAAGLGLIAGILVEKFDQLAGFQAFIIVPLTYLAGVFFNPHNLVGIWSVLAFLNPFLYIIDGFRYAFIAHANANIQFGIVFVLALAVIINWVGYMLIKKGIKIKH